jgi:hypothetical protein
VPALLECRLVADQEKRPVGRPRTTLNDLPPEWQRIVTDAGEEGASAVEIRCLLGIGDSAWDTLLEDYDEFRLTIKKAKSLCEVWWERKGREMTSGAQGNSAVWIFNMKNRFGWRDKPEEEDKESAKPEPVNVVINVHDASIRDR